MSEASRARLCPHCANSIEVDAVRCRYCKAEFETAKAPQWPMRDEAGAPAASHAGSRLSNRTKAILAAVLAISALGYGAFSMYSYRQGNDLRQQEQTNSKLLQEREQKIKTLEGDLKQLRQELDKSKSDAAALAAKLDASQKELSTTQQRLTAATREAAKVASKTASAKPGAARSAKTAPESTPPARRAAEPGVYEVVRATTVREEPSGAARRISEINKGTKITVVRTVGNWLEVRSRQGNPPGYVRSDDAIPISRAN